MVKPRQHSEHVADKNWFLLATSPWLFLQFLYIAFALSDLFLTTFFFSQILKNINWPVCLSQHTPFRDTVSVQLCSCAVFPIIWPWSSNLWHVISRKVWHPNISWIGCIMLLIPSFLHGSRNSQTPWKDQVERKQHHLCLLAEVLSPPQPLAGNWTKVEGAATGVFRVTF